MNTKDSSVDEHYLPWYIAFEIHIVDCNILLKLNSMWNVLFIWQMIFSPWWEHIRDVDNQYTKYGLTLKATK